MTVLDLIARAWVLATLVTVAWIFRDFLRPPKPADPLDGARERIQRHYRDASELRSRPVASRTGDNR